MELNEFVKSVIVNIYDGISDAKKVTGKSVLPSGGIVSDGIPYVKNAPGPSANAIMISNLEFEVSLTDGVKDGTHGGIGVLLGALTIGAKGDSETQQTSLSKIKFNIPIELK